MVKNATIVGNVPFGHFGHSVASLGDVNSDGCDGKELGYCKCMSHRLTLHMRACIQTLQLVHHLMMVGKSSYIMALMAPQSSILLYNR